MLDIFSWTHIVILLGVALIFVGPQELPRLMHMLGKWAGKARAMASEFRRSFDEMARQTELDELRKEVEALKKNNALTDVENSLNDAVAEVNRSPSEAAPYPHGRPGETVPEKPDEPRAGEFVVTDTASAGPVPQETQAAPPDSTESGTQAP
jgi:sec-independent protein translocase protein TatB